MNTKMHLIWMHCIACHHRPNSHSMQLSENVRKGNNLTYAITLFVVMLPEAYLISDFRISILDEWPPHRGYPGRWDLSWFVLLSILASASQYLLFLLGPYHFCPLLSPWNIHSISTIFLKRFLVFSILFFSSISLHCLFKKAFLSLFASLWNCVQLDISFPFSFLFFSQLCKASSDNHFAFFHVFFWGMVLVTDSCTSLQTSVHSSSGIVSTRSNHLNLLITSTV